MRSLRTLIPATLLASCVVASIACSTNSPEDLQTAALKASVTPTVVQGFPTCEQLGYAVGCAINVEFNLFCDIPQGERLPSIRVDVSFPTGQTGFDWSATGPINAVLVNPNGPTSSLYVYEGSTGDTEVVPTTEGAGLLTMRFCSGHAEVDAGTDAAPDAPPNVPPDGGQRTW